MARIRSRVVETESVNQRMLRRGAVKRQHISRWAVGNLELAPGVVGDVHLHPTTIERIREVSTSAGVGQLLVRSVTDQSFADGGDYVSPDTTIYQHGFDAVASAGDTVVWPVDAVGEIQVEFEWDTYEGGGTIEIEVDGSVPAWGLLAEGTVGQRGCKRRSVHIAEGSTVRVKVTQTSGDPQTGSAHVEYSIPDPSLGVGASPIPPGPAELIPRVWYRAESLSYGDGDPVPVWQDISGNDFHLQQAVSGAQPTFRAAALNGRAVVEFDGVDDGMHNVEAVALPTAASAGWTVFAVFLTDNAAATQVVFNGDDQTNDAGTVRGSQYLIIVSSEMRSLIESATLETSGETVLDGTWHLGETVRSATEAETLLDGVGNGPTTYGATSENPSGFYMGWHVAASAYLNGKVAEIIGWDRVLTADERTFIRSYFNDEYGV